MDENNQYGQAMTKPLPHGCIKKQKYVPSLVELNMLLDTFGYLFIADIKFHNIKEKTLLLNEIYPPIFEKKKKENGTIWKVYCQVDEYFIQKQGKSYH